MGVKMRAKTTVLMDQNAQVMEIFCRTGIAAMPTRAMPKASVMTPAETGSKHCFYDGFSGYPPILGALHFLNITKYQLHGMPAGHETQQKRQNQHQGIQIVAHGCHKSQPPNTGHDGGDKGDAEKLD